MSCSLINSQNILSLVLNCTVAGIVEELEVIGCVQYAKLMFQSRVRLTAAFAPFKIEILMFSIDFFETNNLLTTKLRL